MAILSPTLWAQNVSFQIRPYNKEIYFPQSSIFLQITIKNEGQTPYHFHVAEERVFNLKFSVLSFGQQTGVVPESDNFKENRYNNQPILYREVSIKPGEEFAFHVNLKDYVNLKDPGLYSVQASFMPDLSLWTSGSPTLMSSNVLSLSVRPGTTDIIAYRERIDAEKGEVLRRLKMPPDEVIKHTIKSRQIQGPSQKESFFLYLDVESLYIRQEKNRTEYNRADALERSRMLERFKNRIWQEDNPEDFSRVPVRMEIIRTEYTGKEGTVTAQLWFNEGDFFQIKLYTYALKNQDDIWMIYDYSVKNLTRVTNLPATN